MNFLNINELIILLSGVLASIMYVWLGVGYALSVMLVLALVGINVTSLLPEMLLSQFIISLLGSFIRGRLSSNVRASIKNGGIIAISAYASFTSAMFLGIKLRDDVRLLALAGVLMAASVVLIMIRDKHNNRGNINHFKVSLVTGVVAGVVKGVIGAAVTPVMLIIQKVGGLSIDEGLLRSLLAESVICLTAFIPYAMALSFSLSYFITLLVGSVIGVTLGYTVIARRHSSVKVMASSISMALISGILLIKVLLTTLYGGAT